VPTARPAVPASMRTSVPGTCRSVAIPLSDYSPAPAGAAVRQRGFTLVEMLVALLVAAILISMVSLSASPSPQRALRYEAERLAQLLALAREEALVRGAPIRVDLSRDGYRFLIRRDREWRPITDDGDLRARAFDDDTQVAIERADGMRALEFGRDIVEAPYRVMLVRRAAAVTIVANGLGRFEVVEP
ncbi:MAG TPA: GspH/FimT family pseudopilin, partial [Burkholderiaceae bacterium]|nr:GspH/FimT family pseudopilin [Burkholderiaceae bacterium]